MSAAKYVKELRSIEVSGKKFHVTPCNAAHSNYVARGYLVVSCKKCSVVAIPAPTPTNTETATNG